MTPPRARHLRPKVARAVSILDRPRAPAAGGREAGAEIGPGNYGSPLLPDVGPHVRRHGWPFLADVSAVANARILTGLPLFCGRFFRALARPAAPASSVLGSRSRRPRFETRSPPPGRISRAPGNARSHGAKLLPSDRGGSLCCGQARSSREFAQCSSKNSHR